MLSRKLDPTPLDGIFLNTKKFQFPRKKKIAKTVFSNLWVSLKFLYNGDLILFTRKRKGVRKKMSHPRITDSYFKWNTQYANVVPRFYQLQTNACSRKFRYRGATFLSPFVLDLEGKKRAQILRSKFSAITRFNEEQLQMKMFHRNPTDDSRFFIWFSLLSRSQTLYVFIMQRVQQNQKDSFSTVEK